MSHRLAQVRQLLLAHRPADDREADFQARLLALCDAGDGLEGAFYRGHFNPGHFTASSFVLSPDLRSVLLIYHSKFQRWLQPGGHFEPEDADLFAAARREVAEETGVTALDLRGEGLFDIDLHDIPPRKADPFHQHFDLRVCWVARDEALTAGTDAHDARWVPIDEIDQWESDASVMRAVGKLRSQLA